jgi:organic hydroperoxide reductase OsmC/OhrA
MLYVPMRFAPHRILTTVTITIEALQVEPTITGIELDVLAEVPRAKQGDFTQAAVSAKTHCTISRLIKINISMSAKLEKSALTKKLRRPMDSLKVSKTKKQSIG